MDKDLKEAIAEILDLWNNGEIIPRSPLASSPVYDAFRHLIKVFYDLEFPERRADPFRREKPGS